MFVILTFIGCRHVYTDNPTILQAEKLITASPEKAYQLLNSIKNPEKMSDADYAAWCLHYTHAQYKLYMDINSDSLIRFSVKYYDNSSNKNYSGIAYYLWGCISELKNENKSAMFYYKKANDLLANTNMYLIKGNINHKIGYLLLTDEYYSESELYLQKAIYNYQKSGNNKYLNSCYKNLAEVQLRSEMPLKNILDIIEKSESISLLSKDTAFYNDMLFFEATVIIDSNILKSKELLLISFRRIPQNKTNISAFLSYAYSKLDMADSAKYYGNQIQFNKNNANSESLIPITKAYLARCEKKPDSAFIYFEQAYNLREKIYRQNTKEQLIRIDKQYDLSKKEAEKAKLEISLQKNIIFSAFLSIIVLAVLIILLIIINLNKKRKAAFVIEKQKLEFDVKTKKVENDKKMNILLVHLHNKIENTLHYKHLQSNLAKADKKEEFIADITRQSVLTDKEWKYYIDEANELFEGKILKLKAEYPLLTDSDLIVISLICLGIDLTNSMLLLDYSNVNTMYIRRNRIKNHLGLEKSEDLEKWLKRHVVNNEADN